LSTPPALAPYLQSRGRDCFADKKKRFDLGIYPLPTLRVRARARASYLIKE